MSSTWTPRSSSAASVRVAYTAPLAPVTAIATAWRPSAIQRHRQHDQVEDPDVTVQIERALDLRQIVRAHQRLFVDEHGRHGGDAGKIYQTKRHDERERDETRDGDDVQG